MEGATAAAAAAAGSSYPLGHVGPPSPPWAVAGGRTKPQCAGPTARGTTAACCGRVGRHLRRWGWGDPPTLALSGAAFRAGGSPEGCACTCLQLGAKQFLQPGSL